MASSALRTHLLSAVERIERIENAIVADEAFEQSFVVVALQPVDHVTTVRRAGRDDAFGVRATLDVEHVAHARDDVLVGTATPVVLDAVGERCEIRIPSGHRLSEACPQTRYRRNREQLTLAITS